MSYYYTTDEEGKSIQVNDIDTVCKNLQILYKDIKSQNEYLRKVNTELKDESYKDNRLAEMKSRLDEMADNYYRGFPISEKQQKKIDEWKEEHEAEAHGLKTDRQRMSFQGCSGGRYTYIFVPTGIGTVGTVKCSCGAEFEFQQI